MDTAKYEDILVKMKKDDWMRFSQIDLVLCMCVMKKLVLVIAT